MRKLRILSRLLGLASVAYLFLAGPSPADTSPEAERRRERLRRLRRTGLFIFVVVGVGVAATALYLMFSGPRMLTQPKYVPGRAQLPALPEGVVPVSLAPEGIPLQDPLPDTPAVRVAGGVYYGNYCAFCHGKAGEEIGAVGRSYMPVPTPLSLPRIQAMSDNELYQAMLTGIGHEPVLEYVIDARSRWYIVRYVRTLGGEGSTPRQAETLIDGGEVR